MKKTNFDRYLKQQMKDPAFATRFEQAGEAWDVAISSPKKSLWKQNSPPRNSIANSNQPSAISHRYVVRTKRRRAAALQKRTPTQARVGEFVLWLSGSGAPARGE
jgi:hypothetical protein